MHDIEIRVSKQFIAIILFVLAGSMLCIAALPFFIGLKIILAIITLCYGGWIIWQTQSVIGLFLNSDGWHIRDRTGAVVAQLSGDSTVTACVCVLRFIVPGKRIKWTCVIWHDALEPDMYRRLLVWVRNSGR